jgi:3-methyladenine DNA glycosylase/8-oxoguanine DNA glycosylase
VRVERPVDLRRTMAPIGHGRGDLTFRMAADGVWRATRTPLGPGTIRFQAPAGDPCTIHATAWGDGATWLLERAAGMVGAHDSLDGFSPGRHPVVARLAHSLGRVRLPRTERVLDALVPAILEQKVIGLEARRSFAGLLRRFGEPAPGPAPLRLPPSPEVLARIPSWDFHRLGVERKRADTIRRAAAVAGRLEEAVDLGTVELRRRLLAIPGIGPWTAAEVCRLALGDADAVSVGDYHLPNSVAWALASEPRGDDDRMFELLAPFAPHRGRVVRLIELGAGAAPRRGPRLPLQSIAGL